MTRYQLVALAAAIIFLLGLVRAVVALLGGHTDEEKLVFSLQPAPSAMVAMPRRFSFPSVASSAARDPFRAQSSWRPPAPREVPPPPLTELLRLSPVPVAFRPDGTPRIVTVRPTSEKRPDQTLLVRLRRALKEKKRASEKTQSQAPEESAGSEGAEPRTGRNKR